VFGNRSKLKLSS